MTRPGIKIIFLPNLYRKHRVYFNNFPIHTHDREPAIIDTNRHFYSIAYTVYDINRIAPVVRLLNMDTDPNLVLKNFSSTKRGASHRDNIVPICLRLRPLENMTTTSSQTMDCIF